MIPSTFSYTEYSVIPSLNRLLFLRYEIPK